MSGHIPVQGSFQKSLWLKVILIACLTYGVGNAFREASQFAWWSTCAIAATWIAYESALALRKPKRIDIFILRDAFDHVENMQTTHVPDYSVNAIAIGTRRDYSLGKLRAIHRRCTVWSDITTNPVVLESEAAASEPDPLDPLVSRLKDRVLNRAREELLSGRSVEGETWLLNARQLRWDTQGKSHALGPDQLAACEVIDDHVCIWKEGLQAPVAKFHESGKNAVLLPLLLQSQQAADTNLAEDPPGIMGRLLFERRVLFQPKMYYLAAAAFMILFGSALHLTIVRNTAAWWIASSLMLTSIPILIIAVAASIGRYNYHEHAVKFTGPSNSRTLFYADVERMRYNLRPRFYKGISTGINDIELELLPKETLGLEPYRHLSFSWKRDESLDMITGRISELIKARISRELAEGHTVAWTDDVSLEATGLRFRATDSTGQDGFQVLYYRDIDRLRTEDQAVYLFRRGERQAILQISSSAWNFHPIVDILESLRQPEMSELQDGPLADRSIAIGAC